MRSPTARFCQPALAVLRPPAVLDRRSRPSVLEEAGVVVEAGSFYGDAGEGHLRVCFGSASVEDLGTAMDRIQRFVSDLAPVEA